MFNEFSKISRLSRTMIVTEKIDGTNAQVCIQSIGEITADETRFVIAEQDGFTMLAGSRNRWITPDDDNHGFAVWVRDNSKELWELGPGRHFGEWWGSGIQRRYGQAEKHFSLFNVSRWLVDYDNSKPLCPPCCRVVPVLYHGMFDTAFINSTMTMLHAGSVAASGFDKPEGVVIYHEAARVMFKKTFEKDASGKGDQ